MRPGESSTKAEPVAYTSPRAWRRGAGASGGRATSGPTHFRSPAAHAHAQPDVSRSPGRPPSTAGGVRTSAGRSLPSADVGSRTPRSWRLRAARSRCSGFPRTLPAEPRRQSERPEGPALFRCALLCPPAACPPARSAAVTRPPAPRQRSAPRVPGARPESLARRSPGAVGTHDPHEPTCARAGGVPCREHGGQAEDPHGQREAQQEHHAARQRRQDLEKCPRGEGVGRTLVIGSLHLRCLWLRNFPDYSEYQDGHVK